jgi:hypothetical protein
MGCLGFSFCQIILQRLKISCFRHEDVASETPKTEFVEHYLPEELVNLENDKSSAGKRDWATSLREVILSLKIHPILWVSVCLRPFFIFWLMYVL